MTDRFPIPQLKDESNRAYECFLVYCELSDRSIDRAYDKYNADRIAQGTKKDRHSRKRNRADGAWYEWARRYKWVERATQYDNWKRDRDFEIKHNTIAKEKEKTIKEIYTAINNSFRANVRDADEILEMTLQRFKADGGSCKLHDLKILMTIYNEAIATQKNIFFTWLQLQEADNLIQSKTNNKLFSFFDDFELNEEV